MNLCFYPRYVYVFRYCLYVPVISGTNPIVCLNPWKLGIKIPIKMYVFNNSNVSLSYELWLIQRNII